MVLFDLDKIIHDSDQYFKEYFIDYYEIALHQFMLKEN